MGDVLERLKNAGSPAWPGWQGAIIAAVCIAASVLGCTASKPARVVEAAPAATPSSDAASATAPGAQAGSASQELTEIRSVDLREGAPEIFVDVVASSPLVWTSFRNNEGQVVVELPNAAPMPAVADLTPDAGLVAAVRVQQETGGSRPMTRLLIETRGEVEHAVSSEGSSLQVRLSPVERQAQGGLVFEPVPAATAAPSPAEAPEMSGDVEGSGAGGTVEAPAAGPTVRGKAASRLDGIESLGGSVIRISGDGELPYSTFSLSEPNRFIVDLQGVINRSSRSTISVSGGVVSRVRVAQFRPLPSPVARVVFDLREASTPRIERTADALVVTFPEGGSVTMAEATPPPAAVSAPPPQRAERMDRTDRMEETPAIEKQPAPAPRPRPVAAPARTASPGATPSIQVEDAPTLTTPISATPPREPSGLAAVAARAAGKDGSEPGGVSFESQPVGEGEPQYYGEPIDLRVTDADITEVLRTFAQISNLNIVVQPGVRGTVTAELVNVPWDQALTQILKINGLGFELEGNVMRIAPTRILREEASERQQLELAKALAIPLRTVMKRLSYADATEVAGVLKAGTAGMLSQRGTVIVDNRTNTLIIKELPDFLDSVISVIENLDTPEPQVMIEARIIETTKRFTRTLGVDWGFNGISSAATGNTTGLVFPNNGTVNGGVNLNTGGDNGTLNLRLGNVLNTFSLDIALQAAENEGLINILSAPKVATLNNQRASIQSGIQIPIQTIANNTVTVQFVNATLRLDVIPQVTAEGTVLMEIDISKREPLTGFLVSGSTGAPISTKDARTKMVVRDGGTAVIGGIYKVTTDQGENRVPGLANIPILGHLFRNKSRTEDNDELLIFITPRVIKL